MSKEIITSELEQLNKMVDDSLSITYYYDHWELRSYKQGNRLFNIAIHAKTLEGCIAKAKEVLEKEKENESKKDT